MGQAQLIWSGDWLAVIGKIPGMDQMGSVFANAPGIVDDDDGLKLRSIKCACTHSIDGAAQNQNGVYHNAGLLLSAASNSQIQASMSKMPIVKSSAVGALHHRSILTDWWHHQTTPFAALQIDAGAITKFQRRGKAEAHFNQSAICAGNAHFFRIKTRIEFGKGGFQRQRVDSDLAIKLAQDRWNDNLVTGFPRQVKISLLIQSRADTMLAPLMADQTKAGHDIQRVAGQIIGNAFWNIAAAIGWPVATFELGP